MLKPLLIAFAASLGNAIFIFSQRASPEAPNLFLFSAGIVVFASLFCGAASYFLHSGTDIDYIRKAWPFMALAGFGVFITFVGFFVLHTR
jgi:hypothetical protein